MLAFKSAALLAGVTAAKQNNLLTSALHQDDDLLGDGFGLISKTSDVVQHGFLERGREHQKRRNLQAVTRQSSSVDCKACIDQSYFFC